MRQLIIGGSGFLGTELVRQAAAAGWETAATYLSRPGGMPEASWYPLDVRVPGKVDAVLAAVAPHAVVDVTSGGSDWAVTADGAFRVVAAAARHGCRLVHLSSDAVFSGAHSPYDETCLDGVLFTDDIRCPVHVEDLAAAVLELAVSDEAGMFHVAGEDALSRHELGVLIARRDGLDASRLVSGRRSGSSVPGPLDVRLDCRATRQRLRTRLRGAREFLRGR
ncbi:sugar nucleotide-binding protein [Streptomyces sp. CdTB01]|uniref:sugar nucleotide-binding protein n=1 Tax=Streptomyces sp. CdTB01 TaxID=1725411 RepID=UPI00073A5545|nr:sugar nucleotide-binding protein [Streptomyces sp. CdTB01]ALV38007.1 hypothetical protein AS200_42675 [Streptomyces sp. CdTB01]